MSDRSVPSTSDYSSISQHLAKSQSTKVRALLWSFLETPALLISIGICSAILSYVVTKLSSVGDIIRIYCTASHSYSGWISYSVICMLLAAIASLVTIAICPESVGGGLSDMKVILSGTIKPVKLSGRLIVAKIAGLVFALAAGLSVGKEGPVVHMTGAAAEQLMKTTPFKNIHANHMKRIEILACACAAGVSATFGSAYGGVLFSIEVTCAAYMVRNLPRAYLCSICCMLVFLGLGVTDQISLFNNTSESNTPAKTMSGFHISDILIFALFGGIFGLVGVIFVTAVQYISKLRNQYLDPYLSPSTLHTRMLLIVVAVAALSAPVMYFESEFRGAQSDPEHSLATAIFSPESIDNISHKLYFFPVKFLVTIFSVTLPLPVGLFTPVFILGGVLGRIVGEMVSGSALSAGYTPREIALIGSAALSTGVTRAISTVVIIYELSGQPHLRLPLSVAIITAYFISNRFTKGIYDILIEQSGSPFLPTVPKDLSTVYVCDVMQPVTAENVLTLSSTFADAIALIRNYDSSTNTSTTVQDFTVTTSVVSVVALVVSVESMVIIGAIEMDDLRNMLHDGTSHIVIPQHKLNQVISFVTRKTRGVIYEAIRTEEHPGWRWQVVRATRRNASIDIKDDLLLRRSTDYHLTPAPVTPLQRLRSLTIGDSGTSASLISDVLPNVVVDPSPYQVSEIMHLDKVELLIRMLRLHQVFVTQSGRLVGIASRETLKKYIGSREKQPIDKLLLLLSSIRRVVSENYMTFCGTRNRYQTIPESEDRIDKENIVI